MSFRLKTIIGVAFIEIILLVILVWSSLNILQQSHKAELERQADIVISLLVNATRDALISHDVETLQNVGQDLVQNPAIAEIKMIDDNGLSLFNHQTSTPKDSYIKRIETVELAGQNFGHLEVSLSNVFVEAASRNARQQMILIAALEVILVALFSFVLGTYLTRQLSQLRRASLKISDGALGTQVAVQGRDEIGQTAQSFNKMSLRLKDLYEEIQVNENRLRTVLNTVQDGILTLDSYGLILSVNPALCSFLGYERTALLGRTIPHIIVDFDLEYLQKTAQAQTHFKRTKMKGRHKDGHLVSLDLSLSHMQLEGQTLFVGTIRDLTSEELAQAEIQRAERILADAIESTQDGFVLYDEQDRLVICNQKYREIYASSADLLVAGTTFEQIIRTGVERGQYEEALGCEEDWIANRLEAHLNPKGPVEQKLDNGRWIRVWENKTQAGFIVGFRIDITELKQREEALLESQDRFRATIESALDCIICVDGAGRIMEFNPAAEKCFGYRRAEVLGQEMAELIIPSNMRAAHRKGMAHYHATGEGPVLGKRIEVEALRKNGEIFPIELAIEVASGKNDEVIFVSYLRDITEEKAYQNNLKDALQRAEVANEAKAGFLAMMSHEIRTPLNGVLGMLGLMSETRLNGEQKKYAEVAKQSGEGLLTIINDILDFSKMEAGKMQFEESDVPLKPLVGSLIDLLAPQAQAKGLEFKVVYDNDLPGSILCDGGRMRQILLNLAGNAVKFTQTGFVEIRVHASALPKGESLLHFEVEDSGIGIPAPLQDQVFGEFSTIDASYARKFGGTGLGLAITQKLVRHMDGEIGFDSEVDKGSTFWVKLKLRTGGLPSRHEPEDRTLDEIKAHPDQKSLRILIAEDHPTNMMITRTILEKAGHHVLCAADGVEAVQMAQDFPLDLILMDGSMPEMDGMEATRRIRKLDGPVSRIPIIALTAHAMVGDRERFIEAGMNDYLQKPIQKEAVLRGIAKWSNDPLLSEKEEAVLKTEQSLLVCDHLVKLSEDTSPELVPELIAIYLSDARERISRVQKAIEDRDFEILELETHTLGSSAATYGLMALHHLARQAEAACVEGRQEAALDLSAEMVHLAEDSWHELEAYEV